jgi:biotin carboxyl carrier protein
MLKVTANHAKEQISFDVRHKDGQTWLNEQAIQWDLQAINEHTFHAIYQGKSFTIEVVKADFSEKNFLLKINGQKIEYSAKDAIDLLLEKMGLQGKSSAKINQLKAPMPGLIVDVRVAVGQKVSKGENLLVLEAMKMENIIKSPTEGTIKAIKVQKGENVEKNKILIEFE